MPEIADGTVEIKAISRVAGARSKIAVISNDPNVDAVGACIGPKKSRITAVVNEINGEKIDVITYSEDPAEFIAKALAPAEVIRVDLLEDLVDGDKVQKRCQVIVPNNQLSLAIGNKGQNAKLAAKLTGYKIDIKPQFDSVTNEEAPELSPDFEAPVFETPAAEETEEAAAPVEETAAEEVTAEEAVSAEAEAPAAEEEAAPAEAEE